jgi:hypothetical protein
MFELRRAYLRFEKASSAWDSATGVLFRLVREVAGTS